MVYTYTGRAYEGIYVFVMARRSYDVAFKLKAIAAAEAESKQAAARQFKVDARRVREWCSQKEKLTALKKLLSSELSQYQLLADVGCPNPLVDVVAPDNAGQRERR